MKSYLVNFYRHLAIFIWSHWLLPLLQRARPMQVAAKNRKISISQLSISGCSRFAVQCEPASKCHTLRHSTEPLNMKLSRSKLWSCIKVKTKFHTTSDPLQHTSSNLYYARSFLIPNYFHLKICSCGAAIALWFCLCLPFCRPGFESQAHHLSRLFFNLYC